MSVESIDSTPFPRFSQWNIIVDIWGCKIAHFPEINKVFINQWEIDPYFPLIAVSLFTSSFIFGIFFIENYIHNPKITYSHHIASYVLWFIAYFSVFCRTPGYLPYFWAFNTEKSFSYDEQMNGVAVNEEQISYALSKARPPRASFSRKARRIVLKADHYCVWVGKWIGFENYRYFYIQVFWSIVYFISFFGMIYPDLKRVIFDGFEFSFLRVITYVYGIVALGFSIFLIRLFWFHSWLISTNQTTLEVLYDVYPYENPFDLGCYMNFKQVFGPTKCIPCWMCPIPYSTNADGFTFEKKDKEIKQI